MTFLDIIRAVFGTRSEAQKLDQFITDRNPQTESDVEALTRRYYRQQSMQWFNNC